MTRNGDTIRPNVNEAVSDLAKTPHAPVWLVVPVFNAERYLQECLASISAQSFRNIHVVVVDDGSTDKSTEIASAFCDTDPRFQLVKAPHGGVSNARNTGIDLCEGKYIGFVDADDCLYPTAIETFLTVLEGYDVDVCVARFDKGKNFHSPQGFLSGNGAGRHLPFNDNDVSIWDYQAAMHQALYQKIILNSPWGMLMKRSLLGSGIRFRTGIRYEDLDAFYRFYEYAARIAYIPTSLYFYRQVENSFIHKWHPSRLDALDVTDRIVEYMGQHHPGLVDAARDRRFSAHFNILMLLIHYNVDNRAAIKRCWTVIRSGRRLALLDRNVRLKNKLGAIASYMGIPMIRLLTKVVSHS